MRQGKKHVKKLVYWGIFLVLLAGITLLTVAGVRGGKHPAATARRIRMVLAAAFLSAGASVAGAWLGDRLSARPSVRRLTTAVLWLATPPVILGLTQGILHRYEEVLPGYMGWTLFFSYAVCLTLTALSGSFKLGGALYTILMTSLTLTSYFVQRFRGKPLIFSDLLAVRTAATVAGSYRLTLGLRPGILTMLCLTWLYLLLALAKGMRKRTPWPMRLLLLALGLGSMGYVNQTQLQKGWVTAGDFWSMNGSYAKKGFLTTFLAQIPYLKADKPQGYAPEKAEEIGRQARETYRQDPGEAIRPVNLIVIMNESFWDPETMGHVPTSEPILPFWHQLQQEENVTEGRLFVSIFGGGTANTEYEVLTGNSHIGLPADTIAYELYTHAPEFGMASSLRDQGYKTVAIHPNRPSAWNRSAAYDAMGFDTFLSKKNWGGRYEKVRSFASDQAVYDKLIEQADQKEEGSSLFAFAVTIQNHGGYMPETAGDFDPSVQLTGGEAYPLAQMYLSLLQESDRAFEKLVDHFRKEKEPTMIVMFGDHQPSLEQEYFGALQRSQAAPDDLPAAEVPYHTSYLIWTNYDRAGEKHKDMSANYLGAYILQQAGAELTDYQKFLLEAMDRMPVLGLTQGKTADGVWHSYEEADGLDGGLLQDYRTLLYNNIFDRKHRKEEVFSLRK